MTTLKTLCASITLGLAPQLIGLIVLVAIAVGGTVGLVLTNTSREALRTKILEDNQSRSDLAAQLASNYITAIEGSVNGFATRPTVRAAVLSGSPERVEDELAGLLRTQPALDGDGLYDVQGIQRVTGGTNKQTIGTSFADREWFQGALATRQPYFGLPVLSRVTGHPVATYAVPILDEQGQIRGILATSISLSSLSDAIVKTVVPSGTDTTLTDVRNGGLVIADPDPTRILSNIAGGENEAAHRMLAGERGAMETTNSTGEPALATYSPVPGLPWGILILEQRETALKPVDTLSRQALFLTTVSILSAAVLGGWWVLRVTHPLLRLRNATLQLAAGDLTRRVTFTQRDEIGELGRAFDQMAQALLEKDKQLRAYAVRLEETVRRLQTGITERQRAEEHLHASQDRYQRLFDDVVLGIFQASLEGHILAANPAFARLFGYDSPSEVVANVQDAAKDLFFDPRRRAEILRQLADTSEMQRFENVYRRKDGSTFVGSLHARLVRDLNDHPLQFEGLVEDISERKRAEEALAQRNRELALLNRAGRALNSTLELDQVLIRFLEELRPLMGKAGAFWLIDSLSGDLVCRQASGFYGNSVRGLRLARGQSIAGWVAQHGESLIIPDVREDDRFDRIIDSPSEMTARSILCVPLRSNALVIGVLQLLDDQVGAFDARDLPLVESLAATATIAIENARLYEEASQIRAFNENMIAGMQEGVLLEDETGRIVFVNPSVANVLHYAREELIGREWHSIVVPEHIAAAKIESSRRPQGITSRYELSLLTKEGASIPILVSARPLFENGRFTGVLSVFTDITERKRAEEELRALSLTDELTGLYNRRGFLTLAEQQIKTASRFGHGLLLLYADVDHLKWINDTLGHREGDRALNEIATILKATFRESDIVARLGGDEFVVLAVETSEDTAEVLLPRLVQHLSTRNLRRPDYPLSLSVGTWQYDPAHPCSIDELLAQADDLMYQEKKSKRERDRAADVSTGAIEVR